MCLDYMFAFTINDTGIETPSHPQFQELKPYSALTESLESEDLGKQVLQGVFEVAQVL
jgi:hypothetical protein